MEADLGTALFLRSRKGLAPTEAGELAIRRASEVERRMESLAEDLAREGSGLSGLVEVYGNPWLLNRLAATRVAPLLAESPDLRLRLNGTGAPDTENSSPAIGMFLEAKPRAPRFELRLGTVPYRIYRAKALHTDPRRWIAFHEPGMPRVRYLPALNRLRGKDEPIVFTASESLMLLEAADAGVGNALLPQCLGRERTTLRQIGEEGMVMDATLHLHPDAIQLTRVQAVIRWIREAFRPVFLGETEVVVPSRPRPYATSP